MKQFQGMLLVIVATVFCLGAAHAESTTEQLQQLIAQLQKSPEDEALRAKIMALALTLNPKPATPDAAVMAEGAAEYAFKNAKTNADFSDAAKQYEKALLQAPWLADDYFNCAIAHEKAGENSDAIRNLNRYLLASPNAPDTQTIKKRIGGLQYASQKATEEVNSPETKLKEFYKSLDGGVWKQVYNYAFNFKNRSEWPRTIITNPEFFIEVHGHEMRVYQGRPGIPLGRDKLKVTFSSREFDTEADSTGTGTLDRCKFTISLDGQTIIFEDWGMPQPSMYWKQEFKRIN